MQFPSTQVSLSSQSLSDWQPIGVHLICGLPTVPGGHLQIGLCWLMKHSALSPQSHGFMHTLLMQASLEVHSSSLTHPGGLGMGIGTQLLSESGIHPSRQEQIMVLNGTVSTTEHTAVMSQGFSSKHGFRQVPSKQALPEGQSESTSHSALASSGIGSFPAVHKTSGSPTNPDGQVQASTWFLTEQVAVGAHTSLIKHGSRHCD